MVLITFNSCENFFNGSELKDQIDKAVEIANSSEISVEVNLKNRTSGRISPNGITKIKKGVPIEIELTVTSGFSFKGTFSIYDKSKGQPEKIENTDEYVKFVRKSEPQSVGGITNYSYEATILKNLSNILISPDIKNLNVTTPPKLHNIEILNRYENSNFVDYFDVQITVEDEGRPEEVDVYFLDKNGNPVTTDGDKCEKYQLEEKNIKDIGNGLFHLIFEVDLRDKGPAIKDGDEFNFKVEVKNDGDFSSSMTFGKKLTKYSYSRTKVEVFNRLDGWIATNPGGAYPPYAANEYMNTEEGIANHSKTVRLIVLECDENGRDKTPNGQQLSIEYGFTQGDLERCETDHVISFYTAYDFKGEKDGIDEIIGNTLSKIHPEISNEQVYEIVDEVMKDAGIQNETYRQWIYYNACCIIPNPVQISDDEKEFLEPLGDDAFHKKCEADEALRETISVDEDQEFENMEKEFNNNFIKHFNIGQNNRSIIDIPLPSWIDPYKDFYVKVKTDNGINGKKYAAFRFPATPKVMSAQIKNNELTYKLQSNEYSGAGVYGYVYNEYEDKYQWEKQMGKENSFTIPDEFATNNMDYSFYLHSEGQLTSYEGAGTFLESYFYHDSIYTVKYTVKTKIEPLEPFPSTLVPNIIPDGENSGTHTIEMQFDKNTFNKFDNIFLQYWVHDNWLERDIENLVELSKETDGKVSFTIPTKLIYMYEEQDDDENNYFNYSIIGSKDGRTYETKYKIYKGDSRIKDNIKPDVPEGTFFTENDNGIRTDLKLDVATGSFITLEGLFDDSENNLDIDRDNNLTVKITLTDFDGTDYKEEFDVKFPYDKYLKIPIGHLPDGDYKFDVKISDTKGNSSNFAFPKLTKFNIKRSSVPQGYELINNGTNVSLKFSDTGKGKYAIYFFDGTNSQWKNIDEGEIKKGESSKQKNLGKSGLVRFFVNEGYDYDNKSSWTIDNNTVSYPKYQHVPECKVSARDYLLLRNSLRIYSDQPFFVHILQSDTDYGENIDEWENHQQFTHNFPSIPKKPEEPKMKDYEPKPEDYDLDWGSWMNAMYNFTGDPYYSEHGYPSGPEYEKYKAAMETYKEEIFIYFSTSFIGSEINPVYETADHSSSPYVYNFPWDKLTKKYAVAVITWADNKRYLVPIDMTLKD